MKAPNTTETPIGATIPCTGWPNSDPGGEHREEQGRGERQHDHLGAQARAAPVGDENTPRRGEAERRVIEDEAERAAEEIERRLARADGLTDRRRPEQERKAGEQRRSGAGPEDREAEPRPGRVGRNRRRHGKILAALQRVRAGEPDFSPRPQLDPRAVETE